MVGRRLISLGWIVLLAGSAAVGWAQTSAVERALQVEARKIEQWGRDPDLIRTVREQNAQGLNLKEIQARDREWIAEPGLDQGMKELMGNGCARALKRLVGDDPSYKEAFAMDDQGALVCTLRKTSDYWQGDEAKWQKAFNGGRGAVFIDQPRYDVSAGALLVQISVPVMDGARAIGAITVGRELQ